jgi:hypothetical protein
MIVDRRHAGAGYWPTTRRTSTESSGGATALAQDATALTLGRSTPDTCLFALRQREFEARGANPAFVTHLRRDQRVLVVVGIEDAGVETPTRSEHSPFQFMY